MKNLKPYSGDGYFFYQQALEAKNSDDLRSRLAAVATELESTYKNYAQHFDLNLLESLNPDTAFSVHKADLLSLYSYQFKIVRDLRLEIQRQQPQVVRFTCQHCTLTSNESLDHFVPKDEFPEFAIHPLNLLPICMKCNQHKSHVWRKAGVRKALNLYLDRLPDEQYLFVDVKFDKYSEIDLEFYLEKPKLVSKAMFALIESHFESLNLFSRMREKAIPVISELINTVSSRLGNLSYPEIAAEIKEAANSNRREFGANYWKSVVEIELLDSTPFLKLLDL
ncbi:hypothetical protein [Mucilaginibacter psychrotolerans]|uniref:HNH endonuclease n=1 Tax=Mucilaginibacter psychrotolerans TaxID=1524096 RepID=A0A4Y8SFK1_9SPHI|nr:hypothetical protein [Mucilaginibacter psychrotolerans]TFF37698.1 hypothetical protein E2R66_11055 [Mucilaginibacter psychrotolerans]